MQIEGSSALPALDGVQITVVAEKEIPAGGLKAGEIAASTVADTTCLSQAAVVYMHLPFHALQLYLMFGGSRLNLKNRYERLPTIRTNLETTTVFE